MARPDFLPPIPHPRAVASLGADLDGVRRAEIRLDAESRHKRGADQGGDSAADAEDLGGGVVATVVLRDAGGG